MFLRDSRYGGVHRRLQGKQLSIAGSTRFEGLMDLMPARVDGVE